MLIRSISVSGVFESHKGLDRNKLIDDIRQLLVEEHAIQDEQINITGMLVLYKQYAELLIQLGRF